MLNKTLKEYVIKKYVKAKSIKEAIIKEKYCSVDEVVVLKEFDNEVKSNKIGF